MDDSLFKTGIRPAIDKWLDDEAAKVRNYGDYWSASSAGYCMRKVIMDRLRVPPIAKDPRKQRVFSAGHIFHDWIQKLTKEVGLSIAQEVELQDEDLMIRGHFDDLVLVEREYTVDSEDFDKLSTKEKTQHLILYDYKTQNSKAFSYKRPLSHYHKMQLGTYMYMLRRHSLKHDPNLKGAWVDTKDLKEARILKISKDDLRMSEEQLMWSEELEERVLAYWTKLNEYWENKAWPPCSCHEREGGFMAGEKYNPYYYGGQPCSLEYYERCVREKLIKDWRK